jgi:predicted type IV restriction endonuclease
MDFKDKLYRLAGNIQEQMPHINNEEATKMVCVVEFLKVLGYNTSNLAEVQPEFIADIGEKKGEKVDYAIMKEGKPVMLIEVKMINRNLDTVDDSQLRRYYQDTEAQFGVLTNGLEYRFYAGMEKENVMDKTPFFDFDIRSISDDVISFIKNKLTKEGFDEDELERKAVTLKYSRALKHYYINQINDPTDDFVKLCVKDGHVYEGQMRSSKIEEFKPLVKNALKELVNDMINERLESAKIPDTNDEVLDEASEDNVDEDNGIETTPDEWEGYHIVRAIVASVISPDRVFIRDVKSYCGILLDDTNRRPICRLHFNNVNNYRLELFDREKQEKIDILSVNDIYKYADRLRSTVNIYDSAE